MLSALQVSRVILNVMGFSILLMPVAFSAEPQDSAPNLATFRPAWQVGQTWVVETRTPRLQAASEPEKSPSTAVIRWLFSVEKTEDLGGENCYVLRATPQGVRPEGLAIKMWISRATLTLRRWEVTLPSGERLLQIGEDISGSDVKAHPAGVPFSVVPLAFPLWEELPVKHSGVYRYWAVSSDSTTKSLASTPFLIPIEQDTDFSEPQFTKSALELPEGEVPPAGVVRIELRSPFGKTQQLWQAGQPWPIWATNGVSVSRLVSDK